MFFFPANCLRKYVGFPFNPDPETAHLMAGNPVFPRRKTAFPAPIEDCLSKKQRLGQYGHRPFFRTDKSRSPHREGMSLGDTLAFQD